ncbi:uncharacterized protein [Montipora foliosa]|uniref:uncharacterized protein isoform X2 n=2 Tax=Montipora foliosa TaxID=591990 RepID=UPI0035F0FF27
MLDWLILICFLLLSPSEGFLFNVSRGDLDKFSNMDSPGTCSTTNDVGKSWCVTRNAGCSVQGCCTCICSYKYSTFTMDSSVEKATCVENSYIRNFSGCSTTFAAVSKSNPLVRLDLAVQSSKGISNMNNNHDCLIENVLYLDLNTWKTLGSKENSTFALAKTKKWPYMELQWNGNMTPSFFGYIMKLEINCSSGPGKKGGTQFCVVFKTKGNRTWFISGSTQAPTKSIATKSTLTRNVTRENQSSSIAMTSVTTQRRTVAVTSSGQVATSKRTTGRQLNSSEITFAASPDTKRDTSKSKDSSATTASPRTGQVTQKSTTTDYYMGSDKFKKRENKVRGKKGKQEMITIAVVAGVAAVFCLLVLLLVWFIIRQRKTNRLPANSVTETTVIANPTLSSQDILPMPMPMTGLKKNPAFDDSVFAEQDEVELCGNDTNGGFSTAMNNLQMKPMRTTNTKGNIYKEHTSAISKKLTRDSQSDGETAFYHNPSCLLDVEEFNTAQRSDGHSNFHSVQGVYESLKPENMIYQPLQKSVPSKSPKVITEYLSILDPREHPKIIPLSPPEYQPPYSTGPPPADVYEPPEYADYADLDELEEIAALEKHKDPDYEIPVDNERSKGACRNYAIHGGTSYPSQADLIPQTYESHVYAVLEGPDTSP